MTTDLKDTIDPVTGSAFGKSASYQARKKHLQLRFPVQGFEEQYQQVNDLTVEMVDSAIRSHQVKENLKPIKGVKNIIAVASGKGGVGKSTTTVMLAKALQQLGATVGILDADIYGPSIPKMLGVKQQPESPDNKSFLPVDANGIQSMSLGYIMDDKAPAIWRGAMVTKALMQMLEDTRWHGVDYLIMDLPPGTGDIQLTMIQKIPVTAAVVVTTPQDIALLDAQKALAMFNKVDLPVLGVIENMSTYVCENCGHEAHIFGQGGGQHMAETFDVPLLGQLPLNIDIRLNMDKGEPDSLWRQGEHLNETAKLLALKTAQSLAQLPIKFSLTDRLKLNKV